MGKKLSGGDSVDLGNLGNLGISQLSLDKRNLSLASEKDLKTCANIDTKFQQVQKKWSGGSLKSPDRDLELDQLYKVSAQSGSSSVRSLTSRFDYKDNREAEEKESELKRVVNEQQKQISNLRAQVEGKDLRIAALEAQVIALSRKNTPASTPSSHLEDKSFSLSLPLRGHSNA